VIAESPAAPSDGRYEGDGAFDENHVRVLTAALHRLHSAWHVPAVLKGRSVAPRNQTRREAFPWDEGASPIRADTKSLVALFVIGLAASLPFGALYWLMRPTILPNPGLTSYQAPRPDPVVPRVAGGVDESYTLSIAAAKRENELLRQDAGSAFASAQDAEPGTERLASTTRQQSRQRSVRTHTGSPRKLAAHQRQEAIARLSGGDTQADVARTYNVDPTTIGRLQ
jgi:hypothetical protein